MILLSIGSTTSLTSLENVRVVRERVLNIIGGSTVPMILVGTKIDLEDSRYVFHAFVFVFTV